nr:MAG TPA: hypothetical protein [Caudoviricetes sp.]
MESGNKQSNFSFIYDFSSQQDIHISLLPL